MLTKNYLAIYAKSFNWAGFFLPKKTYEKCSALYDFCREADNIADDEDFEAGDTFTQALASTTMRGELATWDFVNNKISLVHVGADDGAYHEFIPGSIVNTRTNTTYTVTAVSEDNKISNNEQNDDFQTTFTDFLDFSEANPFGDPS